MLDKLKRFNKWIKGYRYYKVTVYGYGSQSDYELYTHAYSKREAELYGFYKNSTIYGSDFIISRITVDKV